MSNDMKIRGQRELEVFSFWHFNRLLVSDKLRNREQDRLNGKNFKEVDKEMQNEKASLSKFIKARKSFGCAASYAKFHVKVVPREGHSHL